MANHFEGDYCGGFGHSGCAGHGGLSRETLGERRLGSSRLGELRELRDLRALGKLGDLRDLRALGALGKLGDLTALKKKKEKLGRLLLLR